MRLRTLPLSLSGVVAGVALASTVARLEVAVVATLVLTAAFLQILSNLSNELGDTLHGTDTAERQGMHYSIMDGEMTVPQMKRLIVAIIVLCCLSGLLMIYFSFKGAVLQSLLFVLLGAAAIWAAMHYTLGDNPYGYRGLGDLFVFIFFGLVATTGAGYICSHIFEPMWILPASAVGCFSMGVLNVNNIRDMKTDAATRSTVALKLGLKRARIYQTILICLGWALTASFTLMERGSFLCFAALPLFILHLRGVWTREERRLDTMLPLLVMSTFLMSILFAAGLICF